MRTGEPTFPRVHSGGFWDYLAAHPEEGALFDAAMSEGASAPAEALLAACDLSSVGTVVDVGGGQGWLLAGLLAAVPGLSGVLFDRPEVVAGADEVLQTAGGPTAALSSVGTSSLRSPRAVMSTSWRRSSTTGRMRKRSRSSPPATGRWRRGRGCG